MQPIVLLFPGQGSQKPGMAHDLAEAFAPARATLDAVDAALETPLARLMFDGPADALTLTHNAQPALLAHGAALWAVLTDALGDVLGRSVVAAAGHSLGEFTAHHAAGAMDAPTAARLVRRRGTLMHEAGVARPGAMAALLGEADRPVEAICAAASADGGLVVPANYNAPGQVVISGEVAAVERAMARAKEAGIRRAVRLPVSGAFHSPLMAPAQAGLEAALADAALSDPRFPVYANVTAEPVTDAGVATALLARQLTAPVRWTEVVQALAARHPDALFVELGPGSVLAGLVRKIAPAVQVTSAGGAAEVEALLARLDVAHAG